MGITFHDCITLGVFEGSLFYGYNSSWLPMLPPVHGELIHDVIVNDRSQHASGCGSDIISNDEAHEVMSLKYIEEKYIEYHCILRAEYATSVKVSNVETRHL